MDEKLIATKTAASPLATCAKYLVLTVFGAAVVFGAAYAALELYNHNNPAPAGTVGGAPVEASLSDEASDALAVVRRLYHEQYEAAKTVTTSPGTPSIDFYNGTVAYDGAPLPIADLSASREAAAPVIGWAKLVHKDDEYGPVGESAGAAQEWEEVIESVTDPAALAALATLVPDGVELHTEGAEAIPTPPSSHRELFFGTPSAPVGVLTGADRRTECQGV